MKIVTIGIAAASVVTGLAGAGVAYELATVDSPGTSAAAPADVGQRRAERQIRWKPCQAPAVREGRACVTEEVRLVPVGGASSAGTLAVVRRSSADDALDDHGGDRDGFDDDFDDDDHVDDHGGDRDDDFDDSSGHGSGDDDDWDDDDDDDDDDDRDDDDDDDWDDD